METCACPGACAQQLLHGEDASCWDGEPAGGEKYSGDNTVHFMSERSFPSCPVSPVLWFPRTAHGRLATWLLPGGTEELRDLLTEEASTCPPDSSA